MHRRLDVVFIDHAWRVVKVCQLYPFGVRSCRAAWAVLELNHGEAARHEIEPGIVICATPKAGDGKLPQFEQVANKGGEDLPDRHLGDYERTTKNSLD